MTNEPLLPPLADAGAKEAVRVGDRGLSYAELAAAAGAVAERVRDAPAVAVWAVPALETCVAAVGALAAGVPVVPVNPKSGERELAHIVADSAPGARPRRARRRRCPAALGELARADVDVAARADHGLAAGARRRGARRDRLHVGHHRAAQGRRAAAPRDRLQPRRARDAWAWTGEDVLAHGLPLFHVHGLILGVLGPLRLGGTVRHLGRFSPAAAAAALGAGATMLFGVPTMYHRLAADAEADRAIADGARAARGCSSPAPRRCPPPTTSGSSNGHRAARSSSATA